MKKQSVFISVFILLVLVVSILSQATPAYAADQTIGGIAAVGNLRITGQDSGHIIVEQYNGVIWKGNYLSRGTTLWAAGVKYNIGDYSGSGGTAATFVSNTTVGDTITTVWTAAGGALEITQTIQYTTGTEIIYFTWAIKNTSGASISDVKLFHGGDTFLNGSDRGAGWWRASDNSIGVTHPTSGQQMWFEGTTAPTHYESRHYSLVRTSISTGALQDLIDATPTTDNGYALQWGAINLAAGNTWIVTMSEHFVIGTSIASILPNTGPLAGNTTVVITGTKLTGGAVTFGGIAATCTVDSDTQITCTSPAHAAGYVDVKVTTPVGEWTTVNGFNYLAGPTIADDGIVPNSGPATGETSVVITGTNLTKGTVTFGGSAATCTVNSATQITCTTPAHAAGPVDVVVTTSSSAATAENGFNYIAAPTIASDGILPNAGPLAGGTSVVITGTNLTGATVTFGGSAATCTVNTAATQLTCTSPAHAVGPVDVVVTTPGGTATFTDGFTYLYVYYFPLVGYSPLIGN